MNDFLKIMNAELCNSIFMQSIEKYHESDNVDTALPNRYEHNSINGLLFRKNWIDTVQWHLEDLIRRPDLSGDSIITLKRRIDRSNQERTNIVELIDDWMVDYFKNCKAKKDARMNSETPAWIADRLSILTLKIYHMNEQTQRPNVSSDHIASCREKLGILQKQKSDLSRCFDELLDDIKNGKRIMKVYRQMKMYNDTSLNPQLYQPAKPTIPAD